MHPILFKIGRFEVHSYGLLLAISFLIGIFWSVKRGERKGINRNDIMDLSIMVVISSIVGARLLYVLTHLQEFKGRWIDTFNPFQSSGEIGIAGLTMLGGVVLSIIAVTIFCRIRKVSILKLGDVMAPAIALGIAITRIGCFLNGCCFGKQCDLPWAMVFPLTSPAGSTLQGVAIHPTQLYSSLYGLIILVTILVLEKRVRFDGFFLSLFFMMYGTFRFLVDFVRYYEPSVKFSFIGVWFTINQLISFLMFLAGLAIFLILSGRASSSVKKS